MLNIRRYGRLAELMIQRKLGGRQVSGPGNSTGPIVTTRKAQLKQLIRYAIVYKIGALHALRRAPQTLIVIATPS